MYNYPHKNYRPFSAICDCGFGRKIIYTRQRQITWRNIVDELNKALAIHRQNAAQIEYLDRTIVEISRFYIEKKLIDQK